MTLGLGKEKEMASHGDKRIIVVLLLNTLRMI